MTSRTLRPTLAALSIAAALAGACGKPSSDTGDARPPADPDAAVAIDAPPPDAPVDAHLGPPARMYVATFLSGILSFTIDPDTGELASAAPEHVDKDGHLYGLAIARLPAGPFAYTVDIDRKLLRSYRIDAAGALIALPGDPAATGISPTTIAVDPRGRFVYVGNQGADPTPPSIGVYRIDPDTGLLTEVPRSPFALVDAPTFLAADPSGAFLYASQRASGIRAFTIDADTGAPTEIEGSPFGPAALHAGAIVFHPGGFLYSGGGALYGFRMEATGKLVDLDGSPFAKNVSSDPSAIDVAITGDGNTVLAITDRVDGRWSMFHADATSGALDGERAFASGFQPYSIAVDPTGRFVYVGNDDVNQISGWAIDPAAGGARLVPHSPFDAVGLQPEMVITAAP